MTDSSDWAFPAELQPNPEELDFDLASAVESVVLLRARVPDQAFTAGVLGTDRFGNGIAIREDGLILTIGYLITEAESVWLTTHDGRVVPGHPLAYDQVTGLGLVLPLGRLDLPALAPGTVASLAVGDTVIVIGHGGKPHALSARLIARREFAGYWEYVLDEALFTAPPHPRWSGAALVSDDGRLLGVGSLFVQESVGDETVEGNMFVPIDLLPPIIDELLAHGQASRPPRPWLGIYTAESEGQLVVGGVAKGGPAERAGVRTGDRVIDVGGDQVAGLADLYRKIWSLGEAGVDVPLTLARDTTVKRLLLQSEDRESRLWKPRLQ